MLHNYIEPKQLKRFVNHILVSDKCFAYQLVLLVHVNSPSYITPYTIGVPDGVIALC